MRNSFMGLCIALVVALLIGCAHQHRHHSKNKVVKPHVSAVWIPGYYGPAGNWKPGHWKK